MEYLDRHVGIGAADCGKMLALLGYPSLDALMGAALPGEVGAPPRSTLPPAASEAVVRAELLEIASANEIRRSMYGGGYHGTVTPAVIRRSMLENPAWYTPYTPYQAEISQGRLEAQLIFQTVVSDLTALPIANASMLDEATAAAEGMALARRASKSASDVFVVDRDVHPQVLAVLRTRAEPIGIRLLVVDGPEGVAEAARDSGFFGALVSYPTSLGRVRDYREMAAGFAAAGALLVVCTDLLALTSIRPPGEWGADIAVGSAQRLGVPMAAGGPHAGFMAVRAGLERQIPGRIVGVSRDADGRRALRLALSTREQHIRRERATSNICTAQALHASAAAAYAVYHGPEGLGRIAAGISDRARRLAGGLAAFGALDGSAEPFFDTVVASVPGHARQCVLALAAEGIDVRPVDADRFAATVDETTVDADVDRVLDVARGMCAPSSGDGSTDPRPATLPEIPEALIRTSAYLTHEWFHRFRTETELMRWLRRLADADLALDQRMIPLGSCTMKLNSASAMEPTSWPGFADLHPCAPAESLSGYRRLVADLEHWLAELSGYDAVSIQPNAGSQGEFAGLLAVRAYNRANMREGDLERDVCLIPTSAHGTNAASAAMAGFRVVSVACDQSGGVDLADLDAKLAEHGPSVAAAMITYPSTFGVYDDAITDVCEKVHAVGGQVYIDGANFNALVGRASLGGLGGDVSHLNLHKTFGIPHGGGGPGVGPVAVRAHLAPYLPTHPLAARGSGGTSPDEDRRGQGPPHVGPVSGAPWGNAGVLPIAYAYLRMMGADGLRSATDHAVLAANYVAARLGNSYPVLYRGEAGLVAHECILDLRDITTRTGVTAEDVAKRLIDYGFHAPTLSFPVAGTLMVEPTESESLAELDRFCDALIRIRGEIERVAMGEWKLAESPLRRAPHPAECLVGDWDRPYTREEAVLLGVGSDPPDLGAESKYWPPVGRIDNAAGDRNLVCTCPSSAGR